MRIATILLLACLVATTPVQAQEASRDQENPNAPSIV